MYLKATDQNPNFLNWLTIKYDQKKKKKNFRLYDLFWSSILPLHSEPYWGINP